jgi:hypothetical protein
VVELSRPCKQAPGDWWQLLKTVAESRPHGTLIDARWHCFGAALLAMESEDAQFSSRFRDIYSECAVQRPLDAVLPQVSLRVAALPSEPDWLEISVTPTLPDSVAFLGQLFPERGYQKWAEAEPGWLLLAQEVAPQELVIASGPSAMLVSRRHPWQHLVAMYAISSAIWLQRDGFVLHAASVGIGGKGVLLCGAKGAGKTTLALSFACRGDVFLGDEWAAVLALSGELLPLRRAASIRPGPHPDGLDEYLEKHTCHVEALSDGTTRVRTRVGPVFPRAAAQVVPLTDIFLLRGFSARPGVAPFARHSGELPPASPLLASVWGHPPDERALYLLRTLDRARWWHLDVGGSPEETADMIEETVKEEIWV